MKCGKKPLFKPGAGYRLKHTWLVMPEVLGSFSAPQLGCLRHQVINLVLQKQVKPGRGWGTAYRGREVITLANKPNQVNKTTQASPYTPNTANKCAARLQGFTRYFTIGWVSSMSQRDMFEIILKMILNYINTLTLKHGQLMVQLRATTGCQLKNVWFSEILEN